MTLEANPAKVDALHPCLERRFGGIRAIHRADFEESTSFPLEILTVELEDGRTAKVLLKDLSSSRLPKDDLAARRDRERGVYRDLLSKEDLGTAECYGTVWDESSGRFWLLLELVDGRLLRDSRFVDWVKAAGWLGRFQGHFARRERELESCRFLIRHDADFYHAHANAALQAVTSVYPEWSRRIAGIIARYRERIDLLTTEPVTLVHGSYRPQNILISQDAEAARVVVVDWELAALGSPLYDFAFLADGFPSDQLAVLWNAYRAEAKTHGLLVPDGGRMRRVIDSFRLHKTLKSLGDSIRLKFDERTTSKLVVMAETLASAPDLLAELLP